MSDIFDRTPAGFRRHPDSPGWLVPHSNANDRKVKELRAANADLQAMTADIAARLDALESGGKPKRGKKTNGGETA